MKYCICGLLLLCAGCGSSDSQRQAADATSLDQSPKASVRIDAPGRQAKHANAALLKNVLKNVNETLEMVYAKPLPENMPNWIAMHAALMHGATSYQQQDADAGIKNVFMRILNSNTAQNGPFALREERPWPRHKGDRFSQEHHQNQFLHIFGMAGIPLDAELTVDRRRFQVRDLLEQSLLEARPDGELAFTVSAFAHYLDVGRRWNNKFGEPMSLALFVDKLLKHSEQTCGGQHRLGGLARVLSRPELRRDPDLLALWPEIERQVNGHLVLLREGQQLDGSFTLPPELADLFGLDKKHNPDYFDVFCMGHILEWLSFLLDADQLHEEWIVRAADRLGDAVRASYEMTFLNFDVVKTEQAHLNLGQLGHAVSGLTRWRDKVASIRRNAAEGQPRSRIPTRS